jgi:phosphoglucosamine mutase
MEAGVTTRPIGANVGWFGQNRAGVEAYLQFLETLVPERSDGLKVAVDAANGAAYELAPELLVRLGAEVVLIGANPDGININAEGGATKPEAIGQAVLANQCDVGVAFDGDADRAVFSDEKGRLINGDRTMGIWAAHWQKAGKLTPSVVIGTVMSNGGFESYLKGIGVTLERAAVGDKYVAAKIGEFDARIGGEQSGHIIFPANGPTGDGLATMLELLRVLVREKRPASSFYDDYEPWPQLLVNVTVGTREGWETQPNVAQAIQEATARLGYRGRINVRPSGTQPMIRVMVEAENYELRDSAAQSILSAIETDLGASIYSKVDLTHALGD